MRRITCAERRDKKRGEREQSAVNRGHYVLLATPKGSASTSPGPKVLLFFPIVSVVIQPYLKKGDVGHFGVNRNQYDRGHRGCAFMLSLYKLTGTDRQEGRQTGKIYYDKGC